jgi:hypothetical protein
MQGPGRSFSAWPACSNRRRDLGVDLRCGVQVGEIIGKDELTDVLTPAGQALLDAPGKFPLAPEAA